MPDPPRLLTALRDYLVAEGLVRDPDTPATGPAAGLPAFWREPRLGAPAPGEGKAPSMSPDLVVAAFTVPGIPADRFEQTYYRTDGVDFRLRGRLAIHALDFEPKLRAALADRRDWDMAGLRVIESLEFRPVQPLGSDEQSFDYVAGYLFQRYVEQPA